MRKIMVCIPQTGWSYDREFIESYHVAKDYLLEHMDQIPFEFGIAEYFCHTFPIDSNRNECVSRALEYDIDLTIWVDTDQVFPRDFLFKLIRHDLPIVAGIYHVKAEPFYPVIFKENEKSKDFDLFDSVIDFPEKELFQVDMIGMGCVAIKGEVLKKLKRPYFKYRVHPHQLADKDKYSKFKVDNEIADVSEDVWFWKNVRDNTDYKVLIDPTIDVQHITRFKVDRSIWRAYNNKQKSMFIEKNGLEKFKTWEAKQCRAEAIKSAS